MDGWIVRGGGGGGIIDQGARAIDWTPN